MSHASVDLVRAFQYNDCETVVRVSKDVPFATEVEIKKAGEVLRENCHEPDIFDNREDAFQYGRTLGEHYIDGLLK